MNSPCNCCGQPPCPQPTLEFISVSATCNTQVCGVINPADNLRYLVKVHTHLDGHTTTYDYTPDPETGDCGTSVVCAGTVTTTTSRSFGSGGEDNGSYSLTSTVTYHGDCSTTTGTTGSSASSIHYGDGTCLSSCTSACANGTWTGITTYGGGSCGANQTAPHNSPCIPETGSTVTVTPTPRQTEMDEYSSPEDPTPCALIFPEYPAWTQPDDPPATLLDGQGHDSIAVRDWSPGGVSKLETKITWRIIHAPTGTCYLKVWLRQTFTPELPAAPTITDLDPYIWTVPGYPCIADPTLSARDPDNLIQSAAPEIGTPETNGTTTVQILKWSCIPNYEPDITNPSAPDPNGFPDPDPEPS